MPVTTTGTVLSTSLAVIAAITAVVHLTCTLTDTASVHLAGTAPMATAYMCTFISTQLCHLITALHLTTVAATMAILMMMKGMSVLAGTMQHIMTGTDHDLPNTTEACHHHSTMDPHSQSYMFTFTQSLPTIVVTLHLFTQAHLHLVPITPVMTSTDTASMATSMVAGT